MTSPWIPVEPLDDDRFAVVRRRAIFECCKWDPQVGDSCAIARQPLVIARTAWEELISLAEALAKETVLAENEIVHRPELHSTLGIPFALRHALRAIASRGASRSAARLMRFDFHFTNDGWRISEVNCDVPGGLNEASGFPELMASHYPWAASVGDPAAAYAAALVRQAGAGGTVAFVHATAYSDDQQMMSFVARHVEAAGVSVHLASPSHVRWEDQRACLNATWWQGPLDVIVRFFPAEWLSGLPRSAQWSRFFSGAQTPMSNPATAIVTQTKRFPLVWDRLHTSLPTWRALLPETRDPRHAPWASSSEWLVKPAFGRVGEGVGIAGVTDSKEMRHLTRSARWWPRAWVAQRRFHTVPVRIGGTFMFPCLGIYTLDNRVIGAYGRLSRQPVIDWRAADAAVLAA